jgi:hypothetical protein|tara:strand:+ start:621 stop:827 length:207 start_codon:yes stop_codon:yes gene_type:complete
MRKLTVDEIIQGLVDAYERLLKLESDNSGTPYRDREYFKVKGEVKALRWVLGQDEHNIITEENNNDNV